MKGTERPEMDAVVIQYGAMYVTSPNLSRPRFWNTWKITPIKKSVTATTLTVAPKACIK